MIVCPPLHQPQTKSTPRKQPVRRKRVEENISRHYLISKEGKLSSVVTNGHHQRRSSSIQSLVDISNDVVDVFNTNRHADHRCRHASSRELIGLQLLVGGGCRVNDQGLGVSDIGQMGQQLDIVDNADALFKSTDNLKSQNSTEGSLPEVLLGRFVVRVVLQTRVNDVGDALILLQPLCKLQGVAAVALHAQGERFEALQCEECTKGRQAGAEVTQTLHASAEDEGEVGTERSFRAEHVPELQPVVRRARLSVVRELSVVPGEVAAIDDDSTDVRSVAVDPLGCGFHDDVGSVLERLCNVTAGTEGVVNDERNSGVLGDLGKSLEVGNVEARVRQSLAVNGARVLIDLFEVALGTGVLGELALDAEAREGNLELVVASTVEVRARHKVVARVHDVGDGQELG